MMIIRASSSHDIPGIPLKHNPTFYYAAIVLFLLRNTKNFTNKFYSFYGNEDILNWLYSHINIIANINVNICNV